MRSIEERNALVEEHLGLAKELAKRRYGTVPRTVQYKELLSAAYMGLVDAAARYNEGKVNEMAERPFRCYARWRIQGEMNDYLRSCKWGTRNKPRKKWSLEQPLNAGFFTDEVVTLRDCLTTQELSPIDHLNSNELFNKIIRSLPKREKQVFRLYFVKNLTMQEIGTAIGVCESRVSQIISIQLKFLKQTWEDRAAELWDELPPQE